MADEQSSSSPTIPSAQERAEGNRSATTLVLSLVFVTIIAIGGGIAFFALRAQDDNAASDAPAVPASPAPGNGNSEGVDQVSPPVGTDLAPLFHVPGTDSEGVRVYFPKKPYGQLLPQSDTHRRGELIPSGLMWQNIIGIPMPFSTSDGPTRMTAAGYPSGFSHTQAGALLAAWNLGWRLISAPSELREQIMRDGVEYDSRFEDSQRKALSELPAAGTTAQQNELFDRVPTRVRISYANDLATAEFALENSGSSTEQAQPGGVIISMTVVWVEDRWRLRLSGENGEFRVQSTDDPFDDGWTKW